jgi:hypothetical protein
MPRECEICGRTLRTGRKYCYQCKSEGYQGNHINITKERRKIKNDFGLGISLFMFYGFAIFISFQLLKEGTNLLSIILFFIIAGFVNWGSMKLNDQYRKKKGLDKMKFPRRIWWFLMLYPLTAGILALVVLGFYL